MPPARHNTFTFFIAGKSRPTILRPAVQNQRSHTLNNQP